MRKRTTVRGRAPQDSPAGAITYLTLAITLATFAFPLYWMFVVSSTTDAQLANGLSVVPGDNLLSNISYVFTEPGVFFARSLANSIIVATITTAAVLLFCSMAGFAFAKLEFKGRNILFVSVLGTLALPPQFGVVPLYILMNKFGITGELSSVILPGLVTAFGVFYMRQYISESLPDELVEAARIDGASTFGTYWRLVVPTIRPAFGVLGLLTFLAAWNDFQWPLITLASGPNPTVQIALNRLASGALPVYSHILTGALLATLPLIVIFFIAGRQIVHGIMDGAVK